MSVEILIGFMFLLMGFLQLFSWRQDKNLEDNIFILVGSIALLESRIESKCG